MRTGCDERKPLFRQFEKSFGATLGSAAERMCVCVCATQASLPASIWDRAEFRSQESVDGPRCRIGRHGWENAAFVRLPVDCAASARKRTAKVTERRVREINVEKKKVVTIVAVGHKLLMMGIA